MKKKAIDYFRYLPAMIPAQNPLYGEQRKQRIFDVPDNEGNDLDMEDWAFFPRPEEAEEDEEARIQRLEAKALKQIQKLGEPEDDVDLDLIVKKIKKRGRRRRRD